MGENRKMTGGMYLVIDPSMEEAELFKKLAEVIQEELAAVQIWDHFLPSADRTNLINRICAICHQEKVPVFLNNNWDLMDSTAADGIHFDLIPENFEDIRARYSNRMFGITCTNDLSVLKWGHTHQLDYISFCSVFPSQTSNSCELVSPRSIRAAKKLTPIPVFLAGGIRPENMKELDDLNFDGVAIISGIMNSDHPAKETQKYIAELDRMKNENSNHR